MKDYNVKNGNLRWSGVYSCLLSVVTLAAVLFIATPASAKSGFSFTFLLSDGYYEDYRMQHKYGNHVYREHDRGWGRFYDVPRRHDHGRRHIHKPWLKHRHKIGQLHKHKHWRKDRHDFDRRHNHKNDRLHRSDHRKHTRSNRR